jgi:hypothetical protein
MNKVINNYQCLNISTESYTGKEASPKGLGYSAVAYDIGYEKEGVDKQIWVVQIKNGKKVWFRKSGMPKITHEEPLIKEENSKNIEKEIKEENKEKTEVIPKIQQQEKKLTDYNYFYKYYSNKLKTENKEKGLNKNNKDIQTEIFEEWNRLKKNKKELEDLLKVIKK